ncbi:MAG: hypothetical protein AAFY98_08265 [Verrucomicrobiota bacterium]
MKSEVKRQNTVGGGGHGFALVSVLIVVAVLTIMCVAFMQSMRIDRLTARAYMNTVRAEMAVDAGIQEAIQLLTSDFTRNDQYIVYQAELNDGSQIMPYTIIGLAQNGATNAATRTVQSFPLISNADPNNPIILSGATLPEYSDLQIGSGSNTETTVAEPKLPDALLSNFGQITTPLGKPRTDWVDLQNADGITVSRFTFWIEDLQSKLDPSVVGNLAGGFHQRGLTIAEPSEIALYTLFDPSLAEDDPNSPQSDAQTVVDNREWFITPLSLPRILSNIDIEVDTSPFHLLYPGLGFESSAIPTIPRGFGYAEENRPKVALNDLLEDSAIFPSAEDRVERIASTIETNLPSFASTRSGGMNAETYLYQLAASIIDYADEDKQATVGTAPSGNLYRGLDAYPLMRQYFMWTQYKSRSQRGSRWLFTILVHHYIEIWNMGEEPIWGTLRFDPQNEYIATLGGSSAQLNSPTSPLSGFLEVAIPEEQSLRPNEKRVIYCGAEESRGVSFGRPPDSFSMQQHNNSSYTLSWQ